MVVVRRLGRRHLVWAMPIAGFCVILAITSGSVSIPPGTVVQIVVSRLPFWDVLQTWPHSWDTIIWDIRLPRVIAAVLVGGALGISGGTYQGIFRNPLADPYLIGVASGAGLAATIVIVSPIPLSIHGLSILTPIAFSGALVAVSVAYMLARVKGIVPTTTLILAGVAIAFFASAATTFLMLHSSPNIRPVLIWLLGGFSVTGWLQGGWLLPYIIPCVVIILIHGRILNVMQLDDEQAQHLGVNVERTKVILIAVASLATAAAVSVSGMIGFVGLIAPHVARFIWGPDHRFHLLWVECS